MNIENPMDEYYRECRKGEIIKERYGFVAVSRMRSSTQVVEHMWVHPDWRHEDCESKLIQRSYQNAQENGCRYLKILVPLDGSLVFAKHRMLVGLGFYPMQTALGHLEYERRIGVE